MMIEWSITIGNIIAIAVTLLGFGGAGLTFVYAIRGRLDLVSDKMIHIEEQLKSLVTVLITQGRQEEKLLAIDQRISAQGKRLDDLQNRFNAAVDTGKLSLRES